MSTLSDRSSNKSLASHDRTGTAAEVIADPFLKADRLRVGGRVRQRVTGVLLSTAAACLLSSQLFAQDQSAPAPSSPDATAAAKAKASTAAPPADTFADLPSAPSGPILTLRTETRRVVVDVVVTDPKGRPVTGLTRNDFSVMENGTPQPLRAFDVHTVASETNYVPPKIPNLPANTFVNLTTAPETGTPTVILYDVLNTPQEAQLYAHQEIVNFIKHRKPGTQIAIFVLSDKLHMLQGFTDNIETLSRALDSKKTGPSTSFLSPGGDVDAPGSSLAINGAPQPGQAPLPGTPPNPSQTGGGIDTSQIVTDLGHMEALEQSQFLDIRVDLTLDALTEIGRFLAALPGRKNLIWLSGSFPAGILPDTTIGVTSLGQDQSTRNYSQEIKQATDLLNISHVAVYPVDVRGITASSVINASTNGNFRQNGANLASSLSTAGTQLDSEHSTMDSIAEMTGGRAYYNTNDLQDAVSSAMANGSTYYTLVYAPTNPNFDGSLRKIKVKLNQAGYTLAYRNQYFADDLNAAAQAVEDAPQSPLTPSLEHGTPLSHQLLVEAHLDTVGNPVPATPKQMELLSQYEAMRTKKKTKTPPGELPPVMMQTYLIQYGLIPRQLSLSETPTGAHEASLELGVISYDEDGRKLNGIDTKMDDTIPPARYALLADEGYHVAQEVIIPVTAASVRLAVRDTKDNHIGSLEVQLPLAKTAEAKAPQLKSLGDKTSSQ